MYRVSSTLSGQFFFMQSSKFWPSLQRSQGKDNRFIFIIIIIKKDSQMHIAQKRIRLLVRLHQTRGQCYCQVFSPYNKPVCVASIIHKNDFVYQRGRRAIQNTPYLQRKTKKYKQQKVNCECMNKRTAQGRRALITVRSKADQASFTKHIITDALGMFVMSYLHKGCTQ